jgi:hypothetical protein
MILPKIRGTHSGAALLGVLVAITSAAAPVHAAPDEGVRVELNKLEGVDGACRAYMVFANETERAFDAFKIDLVMFDPAGVIAERLALAAGPLPAGKTSVKLFDVQGRSCAKIDRMLLNTVMTCTTPNGDSPDCTGLTRTASKADAAFFK